MPTILSKVEKLKNHIEKLKGKISLLPTKYKRATTISNYTDEYTKIINKKEGRIQALLNTAKKRDLTLKKQEKKLIKKTIEMKKRGSEFTQEQINKLQARIDQLKTSPKINRKTNKPISSKAEIKKLELLIEKANLVINRLAYEQTLKRNLRPSERMGELYDDENVEVYEGKSKDEINYLKNRQTDKLYIFINEVDNINAFRKIAYEFNKKLGIDGLYKQIIKAQETLEEGITYISLLFNFIENGQITNKARGISISSGSLGSYDLFIEAIEEILKAENYEGAYWDNLELDTSYFAISTYKILGIRRAYGKSANFVFKTVGLVGTTKEEIENGKDVMSCGYLCLLNILGENKIKQLGISKTITDVVDIMKICQQEKINFFNNRFNLAGNMINIRQNREKIIIKNKNNKGKIINEMCYELKQNDIKIEKEDLRTEKEIEEDKKRQENFVAGETEPIHEEYIHPYSIIYDKTAPHVDLFIGETPELKTNIYISEGQNIFKKKKDGSFQNLFFATTFNKNTTAELQKNARILYCFFDYETIVDYFAKNLMREYSVSYLFLTKEELERLKNADESKDQLGIKLFEEKCKNHIGFDCSYKFIDDIVEYQKKYNIIFIGFNNSMFDNFLLLNAITRYREMKGEKSNTDVRKVFFNGNMLLRMEINGRHNVFDLRRHLLGSLSKNCSGFGVCCVNKKSMDHDRIQREYNNSTDDEFIKFITDMTDESGISLVKYNNYDVMSLGVIYKKYEDTLKKFPSTKNFNLHDCITIGSLIYKVFEAHCLSNGYMFDKLSLKQYQDLTKTRCAGRVEIFNDIERITEEIVSMDVCSLYPYVMAVFTGYYPYGKKHDISVDNPDHKKIVRECIEGKKIGFFYCTFAQQCLHDRNLPNIYPKKGGSENDWDYRGILQDYPLSSVMIKLLEDFDVPVYIGEGYYFEKKARSCDMFKFILEMMQAKNKEDENKDKNAEEKKRGVPEDQRTQFNTCLRETLKLLMNSLSGKVIESLHTQITESIDDDNKLLKIQMKAKDINTINVVGGKIYMTYTMNEEDLIDKQRPIYLGVLIYDYAKSYMYRNAYAILGKSRCIYTDTDAIKFLKKWMSLFGINCEKIVPHWKDVEEYDPRYATHPIYSPNSKVFGSYENELGKNDLSYFLQKKTWLTCDTKAFYKWRDELNELYKNKQDYSEHLEKCPCKFKFKGINGRAIYLKNKDLDFIDYYEHTSKKGIVHKEFRIKEYDTKLDKKNKKRNNDYQIKAFEYFANNTHMRIEMGNQLDFFEEIYNNYKENNKKEVLVMMNNFKKIVKNTNRSVMLGDDERYNPIHNNIQLQYLIKQIKIENKKKEE